MGYCSVYFKPKLSPEGILRLFQMHAAGLSNRSIGRHLGISHKTVAWHLRKNSASTNGIVVPVNRKRTRKYSFQFDLFAKFSPSDVAYWAGFVTADGYINKNSITIELSSKDGECLNWWRQFGASVYETKCGRCRKMVATHPKLIDWASEWGIFQAKTGKETFPSGKNHLNDWLRGLIDGDGYITINGTSLMGGICSASKTILEGVQSYLSGLGIKSHLREFHRPNRRVHYKILMYQKSIQNLATRICNNSLQLNRKWSKILEREV